MNKPYVYFGSNEISQNKNFVHNKMRKNEIEFY